MDSRNAVVIKAPAVLVASADDREVQAVHQVRVMVGPVGLEETHRSVVRSAVQDRAEVPHRKRPGGDNDAQLGQTEISPLQCRHQVVKSSPNGLHLL